MMNARDVAERMRRELEAMRAEAPADDPRQAEAMKVLERMTDLVTEGAGLVEERARIERRGAEIDAEMGGCLQRLRQLGMAVPAPATRQ